MHEASLCTHSIFLTLTYDDEHLPHDGALQPKDLQGFIKRLRRTLERTSSDLKSDRGNRIRFFACGEYGETNDRPHYHALIFGLDVRDGQRAGKDLYTSPRLGSLWGNGLTRYGACTAASASYVAQYSVKAHGRSNCDADGVYRQPPFLRMSRRPAIGLEWLTRYKQDLINGYLQAGQRKYAIPRYYLTKLKQLEGLLHDDIIDARHAQRAYFSRVRGRPKTPADNDRELLAREHIHQRRKQLSKQRA